jgi:hypothetical protein
MFTLAPITTSPLVEKLPHASSFANKVVLEKEQRKSFRNKVEMCSGKHGEPKPIALSALFGALFDLEARGFEIEVFLRSFCGLDETFIYPSELYVRAVFAGYEFAAIHLTEDTGWNLVGWPKCVTGTWNMWEWRDAIRLVILSNIIVLKSKKAGDFCACVALGLDDGIT